MDKAGATTPQLNFVKKVIDGYMTFNTKNTAPLLSKNFKFQTFPKNVDLPDREHVKKYGTLFSSITKADIQYHETIEAPGKVVVHITVSGLLDGSSLEYDSVCIFSLVEEDGELKVSDLKDFADPQKRSAFHAVVAKVLAKRTPAAN